MSFDPMDRHRALMAAAPRDMAWNGVEDITIWQARARALLRELLGLPLKRPRASHMSVEHEATRDGYHERRFVFESEADVHVPCVMRAPVGVASPPLIVCLQGHSKGMHISLGQPKYEGDEETISGGDRDFARQAVGLGYAALTIEQRGFGECGGTPDGPACYQPAASALLLGRTLLGERVWDVSRAIEVVTSEFDVDADRICVMGNSGGGTATIYAAALNLGFAAAMPSCALAGFAESIGLQYHCLCNYVPGIMKHFDMGDILALIAPRPLVVVNGREDAIFPIESAVREFARAKRVYDGLGAGDMIYHVIGRGGHRFYAAEAWPALNKLTGWGDEE